MSFCILKLDQVVLSPLPGSLGLKTISCAFRCGVVDNSGASPEQSVYITDRYTDHPIIARTAPLVFLDTIPMVNVDITQVGNTIEIHVSHLYGRPLFSAEVKPSETPSKMDSEAFESLEAFHDFILRGVSSYAPSVHSGWLARIDLDKEDTNYESFNATVDSDWLDASWQNPGLIFDSAIRAGGGGNYKWTYRGLRPSRG
jgi:hypothetical protein